MFSVAPNILLAPNMTQNAERKHRTQNTNTAHFRSLVADPREEVLAMSASLPLSNFFNFHALLVKFFCQNF